MEVWVFLLLLRLSSSRYCYDEEESDILVLTDEQIYIPETLPSSSLTQSPLRRRSLEPTRRNRRIQNHPHRRRRA